MLIKSKHDGYWGDGIRLYLGGGGSSSPPPDPRLVEAQIRSMGFQDDAIRQIMENSNSMLPMQREQMQLGLDATRTAFDQSQADRTWMLDRRGSLSGLQDTLVKDASDFNAGNRGESLAAQGIADVGMQAAIAQQSQTRNLQRMGVNPSSGRMMAMQGQMGVAEAAAKAGAAGVARESARRAGYGLTDRATNALAGYPAMGMQATNNGAGFGTAGLAVANQGLAGMNSGFGAAGTVAGNAASNATSMYGAQANAYNNGMEQDQTGSVIGAGAGIAVAMI